MILKEFYIALFSKLKTEFYEKADQRFNNEILDNINIIEYELKFKFPDSYKKFGVSGFRVGIL